MNKIYRFHYDLKSGSGVYQKEDRNDVILPVGLIFIVADGVFGKVTQHIYNDASHLLTTTIEQKEDCGYDPKRFLEIFGWKRV